MTKEDWERAENELRYVGSIVNFEIDGYKVSIQLQPNGKYKNVIAVYIDNKFKGKWLTEDNEIRRKFLYTTTHSLVKRNTPTKIKKRMEKAYGKEKLEYKSYSPVYPSFGAFKRQITKTCTDIKLIEKDEKPIESKEDESWHM